MPDPTTLEGRISTLFAEKVGIPVPSVETELIDTGLVNSLTFVEFLTHLEEDFGIQVSLEDLEIERFRTIARIAGFVATRLGVAGPRLLPGWGRRPPPRTGRAAPPVRGC
jgi:acyl carrier protein